MEYKIIETKELLIVGVKEEANFHAIGKVTQELARQFMPRLNEVTNKKDDFRLSLQKYNHFDFKSFNPNNVFEKWIGVEVNSFDNVPKGMETLVVQSGKYLVIDFEGSVPEFITLWQYIHSTWLPNSEFRLDDRPHFERLSPNYNPAQDINKEEIWIPIK